MKLHCHTRGCTSEEFAFDNGTVILNAHAEVLCYPGEERPEPRVAELRDGLVIMEWNRHVERKPEQRAIPVEDFYCLKCGGRVEFK